MAYLSELRMNNSRFEAVLCLLSRELCNECHTSDNYEISRNLMAGELVYNWEVRWFDLWDQGFKGCALSSASPLSCH